MIGKLDKRLMTAAIALALVVILGSSALMATEGWTLWRSFYFTLITITTVGHQDFELSETGQHISALIIIAGIGAFSYMLGQAGRILFENEFRPEHRMNQQVRQLTNHLIICGLGRIGTTVCERLQDVNEPFVCIDTNEDDVHRARERGWLAICGDVTDDRTLMRCRIDTARGLAAVTSSDTANIVTTLTARDISPELFILARAEAAESMRKIERAGASRVISPVREGAVSIAETILNPSAHEFLHPADETQGLSFAEITIQAGSATDGTTIEYCAKQHPGIVFVALKSEGDTVLQPPIETKVSAGDVLIAAGGRPAVAAFKLDTAASKAA